MSIAAELMDVDAEIFRLQAELVKKPDIEGTKRIETLLKRREQLLLKLEREERKRLSNEKRKRS